MTVEQDKAAEETRKRTIALLPNMVTTAAMFSGFYSIVFSVNGQFEHACWALFLAGILDLLDGRIARLMKATSAFGEQYDSMSDLISFGFAPAWLGYYWAGKPLGDIAWAVAFIYLACAAIRLARFNTMVGAVDSKKYFQGIPSPPAASLLMTPVLVYTKYVENAPLESTILQWLYLALMIGVGLLMVSNIRFRTFKDIPLMKYGPFLPLVGLAFILSLVMVRPQITLLCISLTYLTWGLIEGGVIIRGREKEMRIKRREARRERRIKRKLEKKATKNDTKTKKLNTSKGK